MWECGGSMQFISSELVGGSPVCIIIVGG